MNCLIGYGAHAVHPYLLWRAVRHHYEQPKTAKMRADGCNVLVEGREQTLDHVRTEHRFELTLSEPLLIGMRRAAQRMLGAAQKRVAAGEKPDDVTPMLTEELAKISQA